jgi:hypothetical protein
MIPHIQTHGLGLIMNEELPKNDYNLIPNSQKPIPKSEEEMNTEPVQPTITYIIPDKVNKNKRYYTQDAVLNALSKIDIIKDDLKSCVAWNDSDDDTVMNELNKIDNDTTPKVEDSTTINSFITEKLDYNFDNDDEDDDEYYD